MIVRFSKRKHRFFIGEYSQAVADKVDVYVLTFKTKKDWIRIRYPLYYLDYQYLGGAWVLNRALKRK